MKRGYRALRDCVFHNPLALPLFPNNMVNIASNMLPYQIGIEVECSFKDGTRSMCDVNLGDIVSELGIVNYSWDVSEQRFRIKSGVAGMIGLYNVCEYLKKECYLNNMSGIHYHVGIGYPSIEKLYTRLCGGTIEQRKIEDMILPELDKWDYKGQYNSRYVSPEKSSAWVNIRRRMGTVEYRTGEMTFDYSVMINRILHVSSISSKVIKNINA